MKRTLTGYLFPILIVVVAAWMMFQLTRSSAETPSAFAEALTLEQATERAAASGKPVFVFATADWCAPCQRLKRTTLADKRVNELIVSKTEPVYLDLTHARTDAAQAELARALGVPGFPTLLLMRDGEVVSRQGPLSTLNFIAWIESQ